MFLKQYFERNWVIFLTFFVLGLCVYGNVLNGDFVFDDNLLVEKNYLIRSLGNFWEFFVSNSQSGVGVEGSNFYRPLQYVVYAFNYHFFGLNNFVFHGTSVLLHIINGFLIFLFLQKLNFSRLGSFGAGLIFILHPVNTEAISYVSGIADPLGFCFLFLGLISFVSIQSLDWFGIFRTFLFFILALLSKELTVIFAPLMLLITIFRWSQLSTEQRKLYPKLLFFGFLLMSFYLVLKFTVLDFTGRGGLTDQVNVYTQSLWVRMVTFISVLWEYVGMMVFPKTLYLERPYTGYTTLLTWRGAFGFSLIFIGVFLAIYSFFRKRIFFLGFFWFFISFMPLSGIIPLNAIYLEHWLYFPFVGVLISLIGVWDSIKTKPSRIWFGVIFLIFCLGFAGRTIARNAEWNEATKFYLNEIAHAPNSARIRNNLAMVYADNEQFDLAILQYKKAIELQDRYPQTHYNLGNLYFERGDFEMAEDEFFRAIKINPGFPYSYNGLLLLYEKTDPAKFQELQRLMQKIEKQKMFLEADFQAILDLSNDAKKE